MSLGAAVPASTAPTLAKGLAVHGLASLKSYAPCPVSGLRRRTASLSRSLAAFFSIFARFSGSSSEEE